MSTEIHDTADTVSEQAQESTFHEVDDRQRAIPAIEFQDVVLAFDERVILDHLSFKVMKGETKIILGGSGGGKSTIINIVLGLLKPDAGRILVDGEDVTDYSEEQMMRVRKKIGMIFQEGALFDSLSVYDNVAFQICRSHPRRRRRRHRLLRRTDDARAQEDRHDLSGRRSLRFALGLRQRRVSDLQVASSSTAKTSPTTPKNR